MNLHTDIERHGARIAVAFVVLTLYQVPAPSQAPVPMAHAPARTPAPAVSRTNPETVALGAPTIAPELAETPIADPFAATSWKPLVPTMPAATVAQTPEAATAAASTPAPPTAPALPFVYIGRYVEAQRQVVMLMKGDQLLLLEQGDTIDNMYRIERITADRIELTYLPLGMRQSVRIVDSA